MQRNRNPQQGSKLLKKSTVVMRSHKNKGNNIITTSFIPDNSHKLILFENKDRYQHYAPHFANQHELMYSSFDKHCYIPPHLSSIQIKENVFRAEPRNARVRPSSSKKYDYDDIYNTYEAKYQVSHPIKQSPRVSRQWSGVKSKIKYLLDEDKLTHNYFHSVKPKPQQRQRQAHPDDDLSQESSQQSQKE